MKENTDTPKYFLAIAILYLLAILMLHLWTSTPQDGLIQLTEWD